MILFIYPFGRRFREARAQRAHAGGDLHARHGTSSQMILAGSNLVGSCISLMVELHRRRRAGRRCSRRWTSCHGVLIAGVGVLSYTLWSGFRASVHDRLRPGAGDARRGGDHHPGGLLQRRRHRSWSPGPERLSAEQADLLLADAFLEQGAPYFVAVLAYAIGNQTIAQRLFAVREDLIKRTFVTATIGYGAIVIGLGMLGLLAALRRACSRSTAIINNLIPQMASTYLAPVVHRVLLHHGDRLAVVHRRLRPVGAVGDRDGRHLRAATSRAAEPNPRTMLLVGRLTMIVATVVGILPAMLKLDILVDAGAGGRAVGRHRLPGDRQLLLEAGHQRAPSPGRCWPRWRCSSRCASTWCR